MTEFIVSTVATYLTQLVEDKFLRPAFGVGNELEKLASTFTAMQAVIEDAERRQARDTSIKNWLKKLKDVAYDVEDLLDECRIQALLKDHDWSSSLGQKRQRQASKFRSNSVPHFQVGNKIKEIMERLDEIAVEKERYQLKEIDTGEWRVEKGVRQTSSGVVEKEVFGRHNEKDETVNWLLQESSENLSLMSIVGMGGLGKTTLAQLVYNDQRITKHFHKRMWVCVTEEFDVVRITRALIESISRTSCSLSELDPLQCRLQEELTNKRVLIVLDDVWNEDSSKWDLLLPSLEIAAEGSRILITTRSERVSNVMGAASTRRLEGLSEEDCHALFSRTAFRNRRDQNIWKLEEIGKEIAKKCRGVPLVAKTIGSMMCNKRTEAQWKLVLNDKTWDLLKNEKADVRPALLLSYFDLPPQLKSCFAYASIYPKDYIIPTDDLMKLWIAEGFIEGSSIPEKMTIATEYLDDLLRRSLFEVAGRDEQNEPKYVKVHDIIHDLAQFVSDEEISGLTIEGENLNKKLTKSRYAFIACWNSLDKHDSLFTHLPGETNRLRTLKFQAAKDLQVRGSQWLSTLFYYSRSLRTLDLSNSRISVLPESIRELKYLKQLILANTSIQALPSSVGSLSNLETLDVTRCTVLASLPQEITEITSLRYLNNKDTISLKDLPKTLGRMTHLETIGRFILGNGNDGCGIAELRNMNSLLQLSIENLDWVQNVKDAEKAELNKKQQLQSLELSCSDTRFVDEEKIKSVFDALKPHKQLENLQVEMYASTVFPTWMNDCSLSHLVSLTLIRCNCKFLPSLGQLPNLKNLSLISMQSVKEVGNEFYCMITRSAFPKLQNLKIDDFPNLENWILVQGAMPVLLELEIADTPKLKQFPFPYLPSLRRLCLKNTHQEMIRSLPDLPYLSYLKLSSFPCLTSLPDTIKKFRTVRDFIVDSCPELESLNQDIIENNGELVSLSIVNCPQLSSLPESLRCLSKLQSLQITSCPHLKEQCVKVAGTEWHKIAHIPKIQIHGTRVQG